ncbi:M57 family metalloprotease [Archangium minus]|uniref:M57 family metalloprotease n=1 Tax=Archangium minus TaxID=83450 RepID=UPI0037BEC59A
MFFKITKTLNIPKAALLGLLSLSPLACDVNGHEQSQDPEPIGHSEPMSFEEFLSGVYKEPWEGGVYIYDGDTPAHSLEELKKAYSRMTTQQQGLVVNLESGMEDIWTTEQKRNLRYCISDTFGTRKSAVVSALEAATSEWEAYADVNFIYAADQDSTCTTTNNNVVFDVRPVSGTGYVARAFFPSSPRSSRNILIDSSAFVSSVPLRGVLLHELGHTLGFRHEHTRPEAGRCFEDKSWRDLTPYDRSSVMHYPQCGGTNDNLDFLSDYDKEGAAVLYGSKTFAAPIPPPGCGWLPVDYGLRLEDELYSCDGRFRLRMQGDGNLVLYQGDTALWASNTRGKPAYGAYMQWDGNLVIYSGLPRPIWGSETDDHPGAQLALQDDGNAVIYTPDFQPIWATNTCCH